MTSDLIDLTLLVGFSLIPPLVYLSWVRKSETYGTEGWGPLIRWFLYGALVATFVSAILELILSEAYAGIAIPNFSYLPKSANAQLIVLAVVIAPFIEEGMKGLGAYGARGSFRFLADGLVFGAAVGLGFGCVENMLYGLSALEEGGIALALATLVVRAISSVLLHGSATAMTGYGIAKDKFGARGAGSGSYYLLAVTMHGTYNTLASLPIILPLLGFALSTGASDTLSLLSLALAIALAVGAFGLTRRLISDLSLHPSAGNPYAPQRTTYRPVQYPPSR